MDIVKMQLCSPGAKLPARATEGAAGYDVYACLDQPVIIKKGNRALIPTGIAMEIGNPLYGGFIFARSGLAIKSGISLCNSVGVIDSDYRGEIMVGLMNDGAQDFTVQNGDRIAQLIFMPVALPVIQTAGVLGETDRGQGGFGSTGIKG